MNIRWLGHAAFELEADGTTVLIDPFLTGNPKAAASAWASTRWRFGAACVTISWACAKRVASPSAWTAASTCSAVYRRLATSRHPKAAKRPATTGAGRFMTADPIRQPPRISTAMSETSVGVRPTRTPLASSASALPCAVPELPDTIAPAWPIVLPGGAVNPAM